MLKEVLGVKEAKRVIIEHFRLAMLPFGQRPDVRVLRSSLCNSGQRRLPSAREAQR